MAIEGLEGGARQHSGIGNPGTIVWLVKEIRWDGERSKLTIIADEEGIANWVESWRRIHAEREAEAEAARR